MDSSKKELAERTEMPPAEGRCRASLCAVACFSRRRSYYANRRFLWSGRKKRAAKEQ